MSFMALVLHALMQIATSEVVCDSQDWFDGFNDGVDITFQVLAECEDDKFFVIGATTTSVDLFHDPLVHNYSDAGSSRGAVLVVFEDEREDGPYSVTFLSKVDSVDIYGVQAISMTVDSNDVYAVAILDTSLGNGEYLLASLDVKDGALSLL